MAEFGDVVASVAEDDAVDIVLVFELFEEALGFPVETLDGLAERVDKPVLFATEGPAETVANELQTLRDADVPVFTSPERAADAAALLARDADDSSADEGREVNADV